MSIVKPQLRGLLANNLKRDFLVAFGLSIVAGGAYYFGVKKARIAIYEQFYKTYDAEKDFLRMRDAGVFTSVKPGGEVGEGGW